MALAKMKGMKRERREDAASHAENTTTINKKQKTGYKISVTILVNGEQYFTLLQ